MKMNTLSSSTLTLLHRGAQRAYNNDRSLTKQQKCSAMNGCDGLSYYGTDIYGDWSEQMGDIESALKARGLVFDPFF